MDIEALFLPTSKGKINQFSISPLQYDVLLGLSF